MNKVSAILQLLCVCSFCLGLFGVAYGLRCATPEYMNHYMGPKEQIVREANPTFDLVFFGSSTIARGIRPAVFEDEFERITTDSTLRSFNAGIDGMRTLATHRHLQRSLIGEKKPRVVVIEVLPFMPFIEERNRRSRREIALHTPELVWTALELIDRFESFQGKSVSERRWDWYSDRLTLGLLNFFRVGGAEVIWRTARRGKSPWGPKTLEKAGERQGHRSYLVDEATMAPEQFDKVLGRQRDVFVNDATWEARIALWAQGVELWRKLGASPGPGPDFLRSQQDFIEELGITPIFLIMPQALPSPVVSDETQEAGLRHVIDLNDAVKYPELFSRELRFDLMHLNDNGAEVTSKILAREIARILQ